MAGEVEQASKGEVGVLAGSGGDRDMAFVSDNCGEGTETGAHAVPWLTLHFR